MAGGGALALTSPRDARRATWLGAGGAVLGGALGLHFALTSFAEGPAPTFREAWQFPYGTLYLEVDALSAFFLVVVFALSIFAAAFGGPYLLGGAKRRALGPLWFQFNALVVSMALVVVARNALVFLMAWEGMALSSFLLVMADGHDARVRKAGWTYFVATHLATAFVVAFFAVLGAQAGSLDFDRIAAAAPLPASVAGPLFCFALVGFGTKAGFVPLHVWLPEAHPAAPTHVSALMSGVMIKTGIYGLIRGLSLLGPPELWWGWALVAVGASSGILGVLLALAQHDLKRLLAYHSVENIGIIALGLGVGFVGISAGAPALTFLGFGGALLHVLNHAVFKSLLFLGAGAVQRATHTRDMEKLGGLMAKMPSTGASFLVGSAAISGLPPLNGFASEFMIFMGAFVGATTLPAPYAMPLAMAAGALALIGGLAAACFAKAVGVVFLGAARTASAREAREVPRSLTGPLLGLAVLCGALGLGAPLFVGALAPAVAAASGAPALSFAAAVEGVRVPLEGVSLAGALFLGAAALLTLLRARLQAGRDVRRAPTWDCGYDAPTPKMQYSASSFADPLTAYFHRFVRTRKSLALGAGPFPAHGSFETHTPDSALESGFEPVFGVAHRVLRRALALQHGRVQFYVLYIVLALFALLVWEAL